MKLQFWMSCAAVMCGSLGISGCDVHRTDPVPEIGERTDSRPEIVPLLGTPEKGADRARLAPRASAESLPARERPSRIDDMTSRAAVDGAQPDPGRTAAANRGATQRSSQPPTMLAEAEAGDARLAAEVRSALAAEPALHGSSIAVRSEDGVVTLRGAISDSERRMLAAHVARAVQGVRLVRNELAGEA